MTNPYASPRALEQALTSKAREDAKRLGVPATDLVRRFYFQRLLARVFFEDDGWMLKGGQALLVRYPARARYSRDIDLFRPGSGDIDEAVAALHEAARRDLADYFFFTPGTVVRKDSGVTIKFDVRLGNNRKDPLSVDLVVKSIPTGPPTKIRLKPAVTMPWPDSWPEVLLYPMADHIADKICAMYERHQNGTIASTRYRDLADLLLISQQETIDGGVVQIALASEIRRRTDHGGEIRLPDVFEVPDPRSWTAGYQAAAAAVNGLQGCRTLEDAIEAAHVFLTPLLGTTDPGTWDPISTEWKAKP